MLFFEPVEDRKIIPTETATVIETLTKRGFPNNYAEDLERINLGLTHPLIEKDGKFIYNNVVVGYLRGIQNPMYGG